MPKNLLISKSRLTGICASFVFLSLSLTGCFQQGGTNFANQAISTNSGVISTASTSDMGVRIYMRNSPTGTLPNTSFRKAEADYSYTDSDGTTHSCTLPGTCQLEPDVYFKTDGINTQMQKKPDWLEHFYVGVTAASTDTAACAKFNSASETAVTNATTNINVQGENGYYRLSEINCGGALASQSGIDTDIANAPLQIRAEINRSKLAKTENIMMVLEYSASSLSPNFVSASNGLSPATCLNSFTGNTLSTASCAVFLWQLFVHPPGQTESMAPFMTVIPPITNIQNSVQSASNGTLVQTRQIIVPLSALDSTYSVLQLTRTKQNLSGATNLSCENNSPLCNGTVFYSVSLYRM